MNPWFTFASLAAFGLALKSIFDVRALRAGFDILNDKVRSLDDRLRRLDERFQQLQAPLEVAGTAAPPVSPEEPIVVPMADPPAVSPEQMTAPPEPPPQPRWAAGSGKSLEQVLAENWLVWLGGLTLALGGAFLVKLSIDHGLLTPAIRVVLGVLLGVGLAVSADLVARRELQTEPEQTDLSYVPQALAAAGAATVFASLYAAYQLYDLLPSVLAFPLLAATADATVIMSLRHGPFVATLGLVGAYLVPLLVQSETPQALPLFGYLAFVAAASLALLRNRAWWWLAWLSLAGTIFWVLAWLAASGNHPATLVVAGFLVLQLALFGAFRRGIDRVAFLSGIGEAPMVRIVTRSAFWAVAAAMVVLVHVDGFGETSLAAVFLAALFLLWFGFRDHALDDVIAVAGALLLAVLASWNLPWPSSQAVLLAYARQPVEIVSFSTTAVLGALLLGGGGFFALWRVPRPGRWAALSAAAPALILVIAYWHLRNFALDIGWSSAALVIAGLELAAAASVARRRTGETEIEIALAAYAVGILGATILAATFALSNAWLSVALALHLPAMGWARAVSACPCCAGSPSAWRGSCWSGWR